MRYPPLYTQPRSARVGIYVQMFLDSRFTRGLGSSLWRRALLGAGSLVYSE
jgi:hypothetical protein